MDLPWGSPESRRFVTNVGLITSHGPVGHNIMSAEWTHHVSYAPGLIAVCIKSNDATHENIVSTKEFGVSIAAQDQNTVVSIAGTSTGRNVDKIKALRELGVTFTPGKQIKPYLVDGAVLQLECKLIKHMPIGDHTMFIGEVLEKQINETKQPLVYHDGKFWKFGDQLHKPPEHELEKIKKVLEKSKKQF